MAFVIKEVMIKNYKSCKDTVFKPNNKLSVLIGKNGTGKTNILKSISLLGIFGRKPSISHNLDNDVLDSSDGVIETKIEYNNKHYTHRQEFTIGYDILGSEVIYPGGSKWLGLNKKPLDIALNIDDRYLEKYPLISDFIFEQVKKRKVWEKDENGNVVEVKNQLREKYLQGKRVSKINSKMRGIHYHKAVAFMSPELSYPYFEIDLKNKKILSIHTINNKKNYFVSIYDFFKQHEDEFENYKKILVDEFSVIEDLDFIETPLERTSEDNGLERFIITPIIVINNGTKIRANNISEGIYKIIVLVFMVFTSKSSVLLIEEPDLCIERRLIKPLISFLRKTCQNENKMIIVSTHSDSLKDYINAEEVFITEMDDNYNTIVSTIPDDQLELLPSYLSYSGSFSQFINTEILKENK